MGEVIKLTELEMISEMEVTCQQFEALRRAYPLCS